MTKPTKQQLKTLRAIADGLDVRFNEVKVVSINKEDIQGQYKLNDYEKEKSK